MVVAKEIKLVMSIRELRVRLEKGGIACDCLVQQFDCLKQICFHPAAKTQLEKILGPIIEIKSDEVRGWRLFNGEFLGTRNLRPKLLRDFLRKLALRRKHAIQIAVNLLLPDECVRASIYQLSLEMKTAATA